MISAEHLTKTFGRFTAVDDVGFTVEPGEAVALWGPNGAGKTTIIRCVLGLLRFRGSLVVAGHDIRRRGKAARRAIGYVPQELALYDDFRLPEALLFFARLKRAERSRTKTVLGEVGLEAHRRKRIRELSGGMKQRMALAIALLADPPLLVLDELTANLDAEAQSGFMTLLRRLKENGKTILFTSHHMPEVDLLADRVLLLDAGRLERTCAPGELANMSPGDSGRTGLAVFLDKELLDKALSVLKEQGFVAHRNARALHVEVPAGRNAAPIVALSRADIPVSHFEVETPTPTEPEGWGSER